MNKHYNSYYKITNTTTITLPYTITNPMKVVGRVGGTNKAGREILTNTQTGNTITVSGDLSNFKFFVGEQYEFSFKFSQQFVQLADSNGARISVKEGRLQIRNWSVSFNNTGFFTTEVTPKTRDTSKSIFTGTITGAGLLGQVNLEDGDFDLNIGDEQPKYRIYDPKTKITSILFFWRINMHDIAKGIRRISVLTAWNGRPVGPSKKNLKKNKFHKWKTSRKLCNQINKSKMSYFCLLKGVREG